MNLQKDEKKEEDIRDCCKYWDKCFQKNPEHFKKYKHPLTLKLELERIDVFKNSINKRKISDEDLNSEEVPAVKKQHISSPSHEDDEKADEGSNSEESPAVKKQNSSSLIQKDDERTDEDSNLEVPAVETQNVSSLSQKDISEKNNKNKLSSETTVNSQDDNKNENVDKSENSESIDASSCIVSSCTENNEDSISENSNASKTLEKMDDDEVSKEVVIEEAKNSVETQSMKPKDTIENDSYIKNKCTVELDSNKKTCDTSQTDDNKKTDSSVETKIIPETTTGEKTQIKEKIQTLKLSSSDEDIYTEAKELISKIFLMPMPDDFYKLFDFCKELKPNDPATAFQVADLKLVGPYDILLGLINNETEITNNLLTHWRYFYDPPEFQTVIKGNDKEGLHFGYWRDRPSSSPVFVVSNCLYISHKIKPVAENIFGAVASYLDERAKKASPFEKTNFLTLLTKIIEYAGKHNITLETQTPKMKSREKNVVARTIHGAGIVCPFNKITKIGYRELSMKDNELLKIIKKIDDAETENSRSKFKAELDKVIKDAVNAADECNFGTCLELGHDLLSTGCVHVQNDALTLLNIAYDQLERRAFLKIIQAHMASRKKGTSLSVI